MELLLTNDLNVTDRRRADADLVRSALEGNEDAFATLFHAHRTKVYSICLRMTNNTAEAEDLTQDAFLQVFRKLGTFRGDSALSTWLHRVAVNSVLMHFRKKGPRHVSLEEAAMRKRARRNVNMARPTIGSPPPSTGLLSLVR